MRAGLTIRPGSLWIGAHWSGYNKRLCINVIPMVTVWLVFGDGKAPRRNWFAILGWKS